MWALGGFTGHHPHPRPAEFRAAVAASRAHYPVLTGLGATGGSPGDQIAHSAVGTYPVTRVGGWLLVDLTGPGRPSA